MVLRLPPKDPDPEPEESVKEEFKIDEATGREVVEEISDEDYKPLPSAVDDAADVMSDYNGRDKTFL